ncbi:MAG: hypothetical protein AB2823_03855 [Candidatus Thiodiazotropha endolucinida]
MSKQDALIFITKSLKDEELLANVQGASKDGFNGLAELAMGMDLYFTYAEFQEAGQEFLEGQRLTDKQEAAVTIVAEALSATQLGTYTCTGSCS